MLFFLDLFLNLWKSKN